MEQESFADQINFLIEIDKLKTINRKTKIINESRLENDAEHSWHLAMMALILHSHSNEDINLSKVIKMLLIHDIVEIDAGDTFAYDMAGQEGKFERELHAANRIFGLLPVNQGEELKNLWLEYEQRETAEAKFAASLDRLQPLIHNHLNEGDTWQKFNITSDKVLNKNRQIEDGSTALWDYAQKIINDSIEKGILSK
jgi:putative hydrolase of HD superfamily